MALPPQFTEGAEVAILPHNTMTTPVRYGKIVRVTKTRVTVEIPSDHDPSKTFTKQFYEAKYFGTPDLPKLPEHGSSYYPDYLVLPDDPQVLRAKVAQATHTRHVALKAAMDGMRAYPSVETARQLQQALTEYIDAKEAEDAASK